MEIEERPQRDSFRRILAGVLLVGLLLSLVIGWFIIDSRQTARAHAAATSMNLATALSREIARSVEVLDLSLQSAVRAINAPAFKSIDPVSRHQLLFDGSIEAKHMGSMFVFNPEGQIVFDSAGLIPRQNNASDRDYFLVHKYHTVAGSYISRPYLSRVSHEWSIAISRRINGPDGAFAGIVVASIRYAYFNELFSKFDLGDHGSISLLNDTGTMIYRTPLIPDEVGKDYSASSLFKRWARG